MARAHSCDLRIGVGKEHSIFSKPAIRERPVPLIPPNGSVGRLAAFQAGGELGDA